MKRAIFGALIAAAGALSVIPAAQAQPYGAPYGQGGYGAPGYAYGEREDWQRRQEWRMHRREFWRQQREIEARRAYEQGQRDAYVGRGGWGYR